MSEPIQPTAEPNVGEPSAPASEDNPVDNLMSRLQAHFAREEQSDEGEPAEGPGAERPDDAELSQTEPAKNEVEATEPDTQKAEKTRDDPKEDLARARDRAELRKAQSELVKAKAEADKVARRVAEIEALAKQNPVKLVEQLSGLSFKDFIERTAKGDFDDRSNLPPDVREKLKLVDEWQAERERMAREAEEAREREEHEQQRSAAREADRPRVAELIDESAHPVLSSRDDAIDAILDIAYEALDRGERPNVQEIIANLEKTASERLVSYLTDKKLLRALLAKDGVKSALTEALGLSQQQSAGPASGLEGSRTAESRNAPRSVASLNEVPSRSDRELTDAEERAEAARALRMWMEAQGQ